MPYYVVVNDPVGAQPSSIANNLWTNQDIASPGDASGDGSVDNAQIPIRMILRPGNPGTHVVGVSNFTIGGQNYSSTVQAMPYPGWNGPIIEMFEWTSGAASADGSAAAISLPAEVTRVLMYNWNPSLNNNTGGQQQNNNGVMENYVGNEVVVLAFVDPNYYVPNVDTVIKLDIDGDALEIVIVPETQSFNIVVQLDPSSNCTVQSILPDALQDYATPYWTLSTATQDTGATPPNEARISVTWNSDNGLFDPGTYLPITINTICAFFRIVPNQGHVLSRHMLHLNRRVLSEIFECLPDEITFPIPPAYSNNTSTLFANNPGGDRYEVEETVAYNNTTYNWNPLIKFGRTFGSDPNSNLSLDFFTDVPLSQTNWANQNWAISNYPDGDGSSGHAFTFWGEARTVLKPSPDIWGSDSSCDNAESYAYNNLPGTVPSPVPNADIPGSIAEDWRGLWLIDTASNITEQQVTSGQTNNFPYDQLGYDWTITQTIDNTNFYDGSDEVSNILGTSKDYLGFGNMPDYYCPSDFEGNEVVVALRNIGSYQPQGWFEQTYDTENGIWYDFFHPKDIFIKIGGSAILSDNCESGDFSVDLTED